MAFKGGFDLMKNIKLLIEFSDFEKIDVRVGVILSAVDAPECRVPAYKLEVDFGEPIGVKKSVAQAKNYTPEQLKGKQILAVVNFKSRQIGKHLSEVLVLGVPTESAGTALVVPDMAAILGGKLF